MKRVLRYYLINLVALWLTTELVKGLSYTGGVKTLFAGAAIFAAINIILVPLLRILLLPLNLLTLGAFAWITNVLALYALTSVVPGFHLLPYSFPGFSYDGFTIPAAFLSSLWVAILASFVISIVTHLLHWISH